MMAATLKDMMDRLPAARRKKVEARAQELIAEEMTLRDLRKACDLTQERMAELLGIRQDSVSRIERRSDLLLSTLRSYVSAMGGSLELIAQFPDRPPVVISDLSGLSDKTVSTPKKGRKRGNRRTVDRKTA
jgi:transcriptional regulator with XRE-family HTH domain